ncbi:hypothetical protein ACJX0J_008654 [Zea mays]
MKRNKKGMSGLTGLPLLEISPSGTTPSPIKASPYKSTPRVLLEGVLKLEPATRYGALKYKAYIKYTTSIKERKKNPTLAKYKGKKYCDTKLFGVIHHKIDFLYYILDYLTRIEREKEIFLLLTEGVATIFLIKDNLQYFIGIMGHSKKILYNEANLNGSDDIFD